MSLATLHTDARRVALLFRQVPAHIAARLCGVDPVLALGMHEWLTSPSESKNPMPEAFTEGAGTACFALIKISVTKPAVFWAALVAIPSFPILLALRWV
ncbi:hypothetical protein [Cupriavidus sp. SW-Y-13]|uniref:hypothetical protein n=1 Tax=Cupriavidus sp. SW-Y-13 TaxID=2653854 RepID=UPI001365630A|nr:hypothetical protein [Cupriavidus sp. SW-Y-13]MWL91457.1 hypothetical protein [Cupriavidus sp. SW-Y-13]